MKGYNPIINNVDKNSRKEPDINVSLDGKTTIMKRASFKGVILKSVLILGVAIISAVAAILLATKTNFGNTLVYSLLAASGFVTLFAVIIGTFSVNSSRVASIIYAVFEGVFLGMLSYMITVITGDIGIVLGAIGGTIIIYATTLALYSSKMIRAGSRFRRIFSTATMGLLIYAIVVSFIRLFAGNVFSSGIGFWWTMAIGVIVIIYAAMMLVLDFEHATMIAELGLDHKYEWQVSLGISVTIFFIYIRILQLLLSIFARKQNSR